MQSSGSKAEKILKKIVKVKTRLFTIWDTEIQLNQKKVVWEQVSLNSADKSVMIVPISSDKKILFIEKFCIGSNSYETVLPGGKVEGNASILKTARKELIEELGYDFKKSVSLGPFKILPGYLSGTTYGVLVSDLVVSGKHKGDEIEILEKVPLTIKEALNKIKSGKIRDCRTVAIVLYYATFAEMGYH